MIKLRNGIKIPKLGLGTYKNSDEVETIKVILEAIEVGYRHFDTAQWYYNESFIGNALKQSNLKREEYYLTTKLKYHHNKEKTRELINKSLQDLQVDYVDLLLIHWPNHDDNINISTWEVFEEYYEKGLAKAIGVSNFTRYQLEVLMKNTRIKPFVNQVEFHPALTQEPLNKYLKKHGIQLMGYAPFMSGHLNDLRYKPTLDEIASKHDVSVQQVIIAWGLANDVLMIPKTVTKERLISNFAAKDIKLDNEDIKKIDELNHGGRFHSDPANTINGKYVD